MSQRVVETILQVKDEASKRYDKVSKSIDKMSRNIEELKSETVQVGDVMNLFGEEIGEYGQRFDQLSAGIKQFTELTGMAKKAVSGMKLTSVAAFGAIGLAIGAIITVAMKFYDQIQKQKELAEELKSTMDDLRKSNEDAANERLNNLDIMEREAAIAKEVEKINRDLFVLEKERQQYKEMKRDNLLSVEELVVGGIQAEIDEREEVIDRLMERRQELLRMQMTAHEERLAHIEAEKQAEYELMAQRIQQQQEEKQARKEQMEKYLADQYAAFERTQKKQEEQERKRQERLAKERREAMIDAAQAEVDKQRELIGEIRDEQRAGGRGSAGQGIQAVESRFLTRTGLSRDREQLILEENKRFNQRLEEANKQLTKLIQATERVAENTDADVEEVSI